MPSPAVRDLTVEVGLITPGPSSAGLKRRHRSVQPSLRPFHRLPTPLNPVLTAVQEIIDAHPEPTGMLIDGFLTVIQVPLTSAGCDFLPVRNPVALISSSLPLVGHLIPLVRHTVPLVRQGTALVDLSCLCRCDVAVAALSARARRVTLAVLHTGTLRPTSTAWKPRPTAKHGPRRIRQASGAGKGWGAVRGFHLARSGDSAAAGTPSRAGLLEASPRGEELMRELDRDGSGPDGGRDPQRTSPTANTPGMLVSIGSGGRTAVHPSGGLPSSIRSAPVRMKPSSSQRTVSASHPVFGRAPIMMNSAPAATVSGRELAAFVPRID
jgi:hypothetical protein